MAIDPFVTIDKKPTPDTNNSLQGKSREEHLADLKDSEPKYGDCGDPSGMLGPLLQVADEMMGAFDGLDNLFVDGMSSIKGFIESANGPTVDPDDAETAVNLSL